MLKENELISLRIALKKIFAFPITKLTFLQVQSAIGKETSDKTEVVDLMKALLSGSFVELPGDKKKSVLMRTLIEEFCVPVRVAKDVEDKGELIQFVTSENIEREGGVVLIWNRMKRVDGQEFTFYTDLETTMILLEHFAQRMKGGDEKVFQEKYGERLKKLSQVIQDKIR